MKLFQVRLSTTVLTTLFFLFLIILIRRYVKYDTVTTVSIVIYKREMPPIMESLCESYKYEPDLNQDRFNATLTKNGKSVQFGPPFIQGRHRCKDIVYNTTRTEELVTDEYFVLEKNSNKIGLWKRFKDRPASGSTVFLHRFLSDALTEEVAVYAVTLSPSPYDTNCQNYNVTQAFCFESCSKFTNVTSITACRVQCIKPDCRTLSFRSRYITLPPPNNMHGLAVSKDMWVLVSVPAFTSISLIQQIVGLVTMFFDLAIIDILTPIMSMALFCYKSIRRKLIRKMARSLKVPGRILLKVSIISGLLYHIYLSIYHYAAYETATEARIESVGERLIPNLFICPYGKYAGSFNTTVDVYGIFKKTFQFPSSTTACMKLLAPLNQSKMIRSKNAIGFKVDGRGLIHVSMAYQLPIPKLRYHAISWAGLLIAYYSQLVEEESLPAPFWTNCVDYKSTTNFNGSIHCYESCILSRNISKYESRYNNYECRKQCFMKQCSSKNIIVIRTFTQSFFFFHHLYIKDPESSLRVITLPQQSWIDFTTYTASLLGLWIGLSAMDIPNIIKLFKINHQFSIRATIICILYCFCLVQIYLVFNNYLLYEMVSKVHIGTPRRYNLPVISFIQRNYEELDVVKFLESKSSSPYEFSEQYSQPFKIEYVRIQDPKNRLLQNVTQKVIRRRDKIFKTFITENTRIESISLAKVDDDENLYTYFGVTDYKVPLIQLNGNNQWLLGRDDEMTVIAHEPTKYIPANTFEFDFESAFLDIDIQQMTLLPSPYPTKCINYDGNWVEECSMKEHYKLHGKHPANIFITASSNISRMIAEPIIENMCFKWYGHMKRCKKIEYKIESDQKPIFRSLIEINVPKVEFSSTLLPKTMIYDLIILISDAIGLWLGISFGLIINKLHKIHESCKSPKLDTFLVEHAPDYTFDPNNERIVQFYQLHHIDPYAN